MCIPSTYAALDLRTSRGPNFNLNFSSRRVFEKISVWCFHQIQARTFLNMNTTHYPNYSSKCIRKPHKERAFSARGVQRLGGALAGTVRARQSPYHPTVVVKQSMVGGANLS